MSTKPTDGSLAYFDEQIEALLTHTPAALAAFDKTGIHQARVATRRLKAGLDLLVSLLEKGDLDELSKAGKRLRRRLGPLRDLDVMIDHLRKYPAPVKLKPAVEWIVGQFEQVRTKARQIDREEGKKPHKLLDAFDGWWPIRHRLEQHQGAIASLLAYALHERFDRFAQVADWVSGVSTPPPDEPPIDVHELRIDGKALRYTFEIAGAHGIKVPKSVFKSFKAMQESLGTWHDFVVLADETVKRWATVELALHDPDAASLVLDLAKQFLKDSTKHLNQFKSKWRRSGPTIRNALHDRVPLTRDVFVGATHASPAKSTRHDSDDAGVASTESETDPDRPETSPTPPPEAPEPIDPAGETR